MMQVSGSPPLGSSHVADFIVFVVVVSYSSSSSKSANLNWLACVLSQSTNGSDFFSLVSSNVSIEAVPFMVNYKCIGQLTRKIHNNNTRVHI